MAATLTKRSPAEQSQPESLLAQNSCFVHAMGCRFGDGLALTAKLVLAFAIKFRLQR